MRRTTKLAGVVPPVPSITLVPTTSIRGRTRIDTVATLESAVPSFALYVNLSGPLKFAAGVYVKEPFAFTVTVP